MQTINERLKIARAAAGFESAKEAAAALGVKEKTYQGHENGSDGFPIASAIKYARRYGVTLDWLLAGRGVGPKPKDIRLALKPWQEDVQPLFDQLSDETKRMIYNVITQSLEFQKGDAST
jgi:DNA-binding XRE family transcriptional regulator